MANATEKQVSFLNSLIKGRYANLGEAMTAYGLNAPTPAALSKYDASGMIEWLKGASTADRSSPAYVDAAAKAEADRALFDRAMAGDAEARAALGW